MKVLKIILYYLFVSILIFIIFLILGLFAVFSCNTWSLEEFEWMYCFWNFIKSIMLWFGASLLFLIVDWILFKSYKKVFALFEKKNILN
jgi:hypothetical protein